MDRFPSRHGVRVVFDPLRSKTPPPRRVVPPPRPPSARREPPPAASKPRSPSYAEIDVVEADLDADPRHDRD